MKNFFKFLGIIALTAVIGFSMVACNDDDDKGGGGGGGGSSSGLTIQNIPSEITGYVIGTAMVGTPPLYLIANDPYVTSGTQKGSAITNGTAKLNAFSATSGSGNPKFTGTATYTSTNYFTIYVVSAEEPWTSEGFSYAKPGVTVSPAYGYTLKAGKTVQFTNGNATLDWADLESN
ncbi:hypothetical protein R84B8_00211 [Treponema sp. R8-4-B8]